MGALTLTDRSVGRSSAAMPTPPESQRRQAVIEAAVERFTRCGFAATRIADIADDAGVGKGTVYEYFRSKEEVLIAACAQVCERNLESLNAAVAEAAAGADGSPADRLRRLLTLVFTRIPDRTRNRTALFIELWLLGQRQPGLLDQARHLLGGMTKGWNEMVRTAMSEAGGAFRQDAAGAAMPLAVAALVDGLLWEQTLLPPGRDRYDPQALADLLVDALARKPA